MGKGYISVEIKVASVLQGNVLWRCCRSHIWNLKPSLALCLGILLLLPLSFKPECLDLGVEVRL